jgi:hypothetical protein
MSKAKSKPIVTIPELVETQNIYRSIERLRAGGYDSGAKRALLHAIAMTGLLGGFEESKALREALKLP